MTHLFEPREKKIMAIVKSVFFQLKVGLCDVIGLDNIGRNLQLINSRLAFFNRAPTINFG